jgi:ribonuclease HII
LARNRQERFARLRAFDHDTDPTAWTSERLAGVDEAGVGPLAGPVVAAAVILPSDFELAELFDSKRMTASARSRCDAIVRERCVALAVASVSPRVIDRVNILNAMLRAQRRAVERLAVRPWTLLVDGNRSPSLPSTWRTRVKTVVGGDGLSLAIAAASVVAKSTRDRWMRRLGARFPGYGFARHKGYATAEHMDELRERGLSPAHRRTFCGFLEEEAELARQGRFEFAAAAPRPRRPRGKPLRRSL